MLYSMQIYLIDGQCYKNNGLCTAKTLVLKAGTRVKVTPLLVLIEEHIKWVLNANTKIITPNTSLVLFQIISTLLVLK